MFKITKKGDCASAFKLKDKRIFLFEPGITVELSDADYKAIMAEYSSFIAPRICSESNLDGCFIIVKVEDVIAEEVKEEEKPAKKKATRKK